MKKITALLFLMIVTLSLVSQEKEEQQVTVEIDFGTQKSAQTYKVKWEEGMTAQTALQYCVVIETHPVKDYIFVSNIEGVRNLPYQTVWYYEINNEKPKHLAFRQPIDKGDRIRWIYKEDVCSKHKND